MVLVPAVAGLAWASVLFDHPLPARALTTQVAGTKPATTTPITVPATTRHTVPVTTPKTTPPTTRPAVIATGPPVTPRTAYVPPTVYYTLAPTTTPAPTTTTTIAGIGDQFTPGPVTLPLKTKGSNGHVDPVLAWLCAVGFGLGLIMVLIRLFLTRSGGRDRAPLT